MWVSNSTKKASKAYLPDPCVELCVGQNSSQKPITINPLLHSCRQTHFCNGMIKNRMLRRVCSRCCSIHHKDNKLPTFRFPPEQRMRAGLFYHDNSYDVISKHSNLLRGYKSNFQSNICILKCIFNNIYPLKHWRTTVMVSKVCWDTLEFAYFVRGWMDSFWKGVWSKRHRQKQTPTERSASL